MLGDRPVQFLPLVQMNANATRGRVPLIVRYMWALSQLARRGKLQQFNILDFHRIEPVALFGSKWQWMNVLLHQDMSVLRSADSDIMWRHAPWLYEAIERRLFRRVVRIFAVRQSAVDRYRALYPELSDKFAFLPTWVDNTLFHPERSEEARQSLRISILGGLGVDTRRRVLINVGRLDSQKDPLLLLEAFAQLSAHSQDLHLLLVGDGDLRARVTSTISTLGLGGRVTLLGVKAPEEIARLLRASDLFVLSSAYEGMPIAVLEALAAGVPVASTDVGEIRLVVRQGISGAISTGRTAAQFSACMAKALQSLDRMRGDPCVESVRPYWPQKVLGAMYENHREQGRMGARTAGPPVPG